jgi:hypothetical protein
LKEAPDHCAETNYYGYETEGIAYAGLHGGKDFGGWQTGRKPQADAYEEECQECVEPGE